jgi:hypothetical protein
MSRSVGQQQVVRGDLGSHVDPLGLRPAQHLDRPGGRHVRDVDPRSGVPRQHHVAGDDDLLGDAGPARQAEPSGQLALVAAGRGTGQGRVLGVLGHDAAERLDVLQRPTHDARIVDTPAIVGEDAHTCAGAVHQPELGELLATQSAGHRTNGLHVHEARLAPELPDAGRGLGGVGDRAGVGHREDRRVAAERGRLRAGEDRLGVLTTGLAQVGVQVHEAGQRHEAVGVDRLGARRGCVHQHTVVVDVEVARVLVEQRGSLDHQRHQATPPSVSPASRW